MKKFLSITLFGCLFSSSTNVFAGTCAAPTAVLVGGACNTIGVSQTAGAPVAPAACTGTIAREEWFSFSGTVGANYLITFTTSTNDNPCIAVYTGACGSLTLVGCDNSTGTGNPITDSYSFTAGSTTTYLVRVLNYGSGTMGGSLCITSPPIGDEPCFALPLTVNATCSYSSYSNAAMTTSVGHPAPGCSSFVNNDIWFSVTVPASGMLAFDSNTGVILDGGMAVYSGSCGALSLVACDDDNSSNGLCHIFF